MAKISLNQSMIDASCEIGDLRDAFEVSRASKVDEKKMIEAEVKKFLHGFFKGGHFTDNRRGFLRFSNKVPGLADSKFDRLVANGYLAVKREKVIDTFYEISEFFRPSVRRFLTNGYPDAQMKKFFAFVRGSSGNSVT